LRLDRPAREFKANGAMKLVTLLLVGALCGTIWWKSGAGVGGGPDQANSNPFTEEVVAECRALAAR
jgi:hypothetical protein